MRSFCCFYQIRQLYYDKDFQLNGDCIDETFFGQFVELLKINLACVRLAECLRIETRLDLVAHESET